MEKIENNDTLLISEILDKVILPYTAEEIKKILEDDNNYETAQQVIDNKFTRPLSDYKFQAWSRYNETIKLAKETEECSSVNSISLAFEMMTKRYLHPSIITACRNLNELYVYLDCLEKDEIDDFKIFNIKYELHPVVVKESLDFAVQETFIEKIMNFIKNIFVRKKYKGKRFIEK